MKIISVLDISIWTLLRLHTELQEISDKLDSLAAEFEGGQLDFDSLDDAKLKVEQCCRRLENAFAKSGNADSGQ